MASATTAGTPAVVEKTAEELRKEIDELHRQQREVRFSPLFSSISSFGCAVCIRYGSRGVSGHLQITERLRDPRGLRRAGLAQNGPRSIVGVRSRGFVRPVSGDEMFFLPIFS